MSMDYFGGSIVGVALTNDEFEVYEEHLNDLGRDVFDIFPNNVYLNEESTSTTDAVFDAPSFMVLGLDKQPDLFSVQYKSQEDAINEIKRKLGEYAPEDIELRFGTFDFAIWG